MLYNVHCTMYIAVRCFTLPPKCYILLYIVFTSSVVHGPEVFYTYVQLCTLLYSFALSFIVFYIKF